MSGWLRLHAIALGAALRRLRSQPYTFVVSALVLGLAIALPLTAAAVLRSVAAITRGIDTEPHVNVYLALDATGDDAKRVESALRAHPDALAVRYIPRAQALEELRRTTQLADVLASLDANPLPDAFTVRVRTTDAGRIAAARAAWSALPKVDQVVADFEWARRLSRWTRLGERLLVVVGGVLALAVLFIVGHLIRLQVVTRREEIVVSQLVGATAADVRRPFLYHGALQGLVAGAAALGIGAAVAWGIRAEVLALTPEYAPDLAAFFLLPATLLAVLGGTALLGLVAAWLAAGREVRRFAGPARRP